MANRKQKQQQQQQVGGGSSSSFTVDLFGPKDSSPSPSPAGHFGSMFGPQSTGLGRESSHSGTYYKRNHDFADAKHGTTTFDNSNNNRTKGEGGSISGKDRNLIYQNEMAEPCYFNSSIYYGGQEVYSPKTQTTSSHHYFKKDDGEDGSNGSNSNSATRGDWWQGSLYY